MSSFRDQSWSTREQSLGDEAEGAYEQWAAEARVGFVRYGICRPPLRVADLPPFIRYTPDYLMSKRLVEVQGFGRDQKFKLKFEKLDALVEWQRHHPVDLFAWDRTNQRCFRVSLDAITEAVAAGRCPDGMFPEDKPYWEFSADLLAEIGEVL